MISVSYSTYTASQAESKLDSLSNKLFKDAGFAMHQCRHEEGLI